MFLNSSEKGFHVQMCMCSNGATCLKICRMFKESDPITQSHPKGSFLKKKFYYLNKPHLYLYKYVI